MKQLPISISLCYHCSGKQLQSGRGGVGVGSAPKEGDIVWGVHGSCCILWAELELLYLSCPSQGTTLGVNSPLLQQECLLLKATPWGPSLLFVPREGPGPWLLGGQRLGVWLSYRADCLGIPAALVSPSPGSCEYVLGCGERRQWRHGGACVQLLSENQVLDVTDAFWVRPRCPLLWGAGALDQRASLGEKLIRGQSWSMCTCVGITHLVFIYFFFSFLLVVGCQLTHVPRISFFYVISNSWVLFLSPRWSICEAKQCAHSHTAGEWSLDLSPAGVHAKAHPSQKYLAVCFLWEDTKVCLCILFTISLLSWSWSHSILQFDTWLPPLRGSSHPWSYHCVASGETDAHLWR